MQKLAGVSFVVGSVLLAAPAQDGVSSAAAAIVRAAAARGAVPEPSAFVVEEIVNLHRHRIARPVGGAPLALDVRIVEVRLADGGTKQVLQIGLATAVAGPADARDPADLVLVIDCSGSMADDAKLERVREAMRTLLCRLQPADRVAVIGYDDEARVLLPLCSVSQRPRILAAIDGLRPGSATNLHAGLMLGIAVAAEARGVAAPRVLLLTDGIANRGITDPGLIALQARTGAGERVAVSTIGVGQDVQHELLRTIARETRGQHHFLADAGDIARVFVQELGSLVAPAAKDLHLRVELDPELQVERLFGYRGRCADGRLFFELEDLGSDSTMVVLAELRPCMATAGRTRFPIRVVAEGRDAGCGNPVRLEQVVSLQAAETAADDEVTRNWRIAQLAQAMREAAVQHGQGRDEQAIARVEAGLHEICDERDADVARVAETARNLRRALAGSACVDR